MSSLSLILASAPDDYSIDKADEPTWTPDPQVGQTISANYVAGSYLSNVPVGAESVTYYLDGVEKASSYVLLSGDLGKPVTALVTVSNPCGATFSFTVEATVVQATNTAPTASDTSIIFNPLPGTVDVPDAFVIGDWSVADATTGGKVDVTITSLPANNGATITDVEYQVDAGAWTSSGGTGNFSITGLTDDVQVGIKLRAVNAIGNAAAGDSKNVTPTTASSGITLVQTAAVYTSTNNVSSYTLPDITVAAGGTVSIQFSGGKNAATDTPSFTPTLAGNAPDTIIAKGDTDTSNRRFNCTAVWKNLTAGAKTPVFNSSLSLRALAGTVQEWAGINTTNPTGATDGGASTSNGTARNQSLTTLYANSFILFSCSLDDWNKTITPSGDFTEVHNSTTGSLTGDQRVSHGYHDAGPAGAHTATWTFSGGDGWASTAVELRAA